MSCIETTELGESSTVISGSSTKDIFLMAHVNRNWSFLFLGSGFAQIFKQIVSIRVKTLSNANLVASRCFKGKDLISS